MNACLLSPSVIKSNEAWEYFSRHDYVKHLKKEKCNCNHDLKSFICTYSQKCFNEVLKNCKKFATIYSISWYGSMF